MEPTPRPARATAPADSSSRPLVGVPPAEHPPTIVRRTAPDDVLESIAVFAQVADEGRWLGTEAGFDRDHRAEQLRAAIDAPDTSRPLVVEWTTTGEIVGTGHAHLRSYGVVEIGMCLVTRWRGQGIGVQLLDELVTQSRDLGGHKVALQVFPHNERAVALYRARGFVIEGRLVRHYRRRDGQLWDAILMGLPLDDVDPPRPPRGDPPG